MPLQKLQFRPGVNREGTTLANEGGWFECDKIRFRSGYPEKIGGWSALSYNTYTGVCRSLWNWVTLKNYNLLGVGTNEKFYIESGGLYNDITPAGLPAGLPITTIGTGWGAGPWPPYLTATLTDPFTAASTGVSTLNVHQVGHGLSTGDSVYFSSIASDPCGINRLALQKAFRITKVDNDNYTISTVIGQAPGPVITYTTTSTAASGGAVVVRYPSTSVPASADRGWGDGYTSTFQLQLRLWSQANFGEYLLFNPRGGAIYIWQPGTAATPNFTQAGVQLSDTAVTPPGWTSIVTDATCPDLVNEILVSDTSRIVIAFGCNDPSGTLFPQLTNTIDPLLIRWTAQESFADWTPSATNQAGSYRLSHGSSIIGALQTRQEILVWTDSAIYSMQYLGAPYVYGFTILADNISIISPNATATANGVTYWMGTDKFYMYSGRVETLPCSLRQFVFNDINRTQGAQCFAGTNEGYSEVWWFYCSANSNIIDRYVIFNYLDRVWYYGTLNRTAWLDSALRKYPQAAAPSLSNFTGDISFDPVTNITTLNVTNTTYGTITVGSAVFGAGVTEGTVITAAGTGGGGVGTYILNKAQTVGSTTMTTGIAGNLIVYHEAAVDDGTTNPPSAIDAYVQSSDFDIGDGHNYGFVWQIIPDITFDGSNTSGTTTTNPSVKFTVRPRQNPGSNYGIADEPTVQSASTQNYKNTTTYNVQQFTEIVYTRIRGRQMAFKIESNTVGTQWQLGTPRINVRPDGRR